MKTDLSRMPFSRCGSYITVRELAADNSRKPGELAPGIWLGGVHGFHAGRDSFRIALRRDGQELPLAAAAEPSHLTLRAEEACAELCIPEAGHVRFRCRGAALCLHLRDGRYNYVIDQGGGRWLVNTAQSFLLTTLHVLRGTAAWEGDWTHPGAGNLCLVLTPDAGGEAELSLHPHVGFAQPDAPAAPFDDAVAGVADAFDAFLAPYRTVPPEWLETVELGAFLNWSSIVEPRGHFKRPSMLMSKNWMCNVWSWDHAINALGLGAAHPELAWDQLLTLFDHQLPTGQLPDFVNDTGRLYNYVKPPIHGWILSRLLERHAWFDHTGRLAAFYEPLARWTRWWLRFRCNGQHGLPEYYHGNDSGWDNGTVFDVGTPVAGPECAAFLVLQMNVLAELADRFDRAADAEEWRRRSDAMFERMLQAWDGRRFRVVDRHGRRAEPSDSVFGCLPVVLGTLLPLEIRAALVAEIRRHLTEWGPATEHPDSPAYDAEGYWRGPIWAPPTLILTDGLQRMGETELAADIAARFSRLCRRGGFAENFNAVTGEPLCDPAYTWTSSVFLLLCGMANSTTPGGAQ